MATIIILISVYIAAQMLADIASLKIVLIAGLSMDAGTFIYPITFTFRDLVHKVIGAKSARVLIVAAAAINLFMALFFALVSALPGDASAGNMSTFGALLNPMWRIVVASIVAEVVSELLDTEAYSAWVHKFGERRQWARVLASNAVSVPIDSAIFCVLAFWGTMPNEVVLSIFVANVVIKGIVTLFSIPLIYVVRERRGKAIQ
jgi:uncharacterized integral membrane protein (TIGR00697 family)